MPLHAEFSRGHPEDPRILLARDRARDLIAARATAEATFYDMALGEFTDAVHGDLVERHDITGMICAADALAFHAAVAVALLAEQRGTSVDEAIAWVADIIDGVAEPR